MKETVSGCFFLYNVYEIYHNSRLTRNLKYVQTK